MDLIARSRNWRIGYPPELLIHGEEIEGVPALRDLIAAHADDRHSPELDGAPARWTAQRVPRVPPAHAAVRRDHVSLRHGPFDGDLEVPERLAEHPKERLELLRAAQRAVAEAVGDAVRCHQP